MKFLYFLALIGLGVAGWSSYRQGQLASLHPLLDPATHAATAGDTVEEDAPKIADTGTGEPAPREAAVASSAAPAESDATSRLEERRQQREMEAEEKRIAREEEVARRAAREQTLLQQRSAIQVEIDALTRRHGELSVQLKEAETNRANQERAWTAQTIKIDQNQKEQLREASRKFIDGIKAERDEVSQQLKDKRRELYSLKS